MNSMKKKTNKSYLKNIIHVIPLLLGVVAISYSVFLIKDIEVPEVLPVTDIQVNGELYFLDKEEIKAIVKKNISGDYFTVDLHHVRDILKQKPWVKNVSLRRQWPASINVFVVEQVPVAYWNEDGYINEAGDVFKPVSLDTSLNLPRLNGPEGQHDNVWKFMNVLYKETALLNYEVVRLNLDDRRAWQLVIISNLEAESSDSKIDSIDVKLGRFDTEKRLQRFIRILPALAVEDGLVENKIKVIDMRYPNGFAVQMTENNDSQSISFLHEYNIPLEFVCLQKPAVMQMSEA